MPLYKLLKKSKRFEWTEEAQQALDQMKSFLTMPPVLVSLVTRENLLHYVAATMRTVSVALVVEHKEEGHVLKVQRPVYLISEFLSDSKARYSQD